jgi:predicted Fe-Mo cluster-binding NifX family protein
LKTRVIVPVEDKNGLDARIAEHFGRAPFYTVVTLDEERNVEGVETVENKGEHFGGHGCHMHDQLFRLKPNAIITYDMGPRGLWGFQDAGVAVIKASADTVKDVIDAYKSDKLEELRERCHHAHHHH